ncbi:3-keto-disaccharide hydrolase [Aeoliella sp. SH292]|uniref:3-keto-disaccharide hydrolase n=1 Tax=Aeoliella sp. SH292 TaxID=3454464 RepID=UPI003F9B8044
MRTLVLSTLLMLIAIPALAEEKSKPLFDGSTLKGWHADVPAMDDDKNAKSPFIVRDGNLVSLGTPGGHLITDDEFENYRLEVEYRFAGEPGNCGVLVHASKPRRLYGMFPQSLEVQMMHENAGDFWCIGEDIEVENMVERRGPKETWGVDGDKNRRILNLTDGSEKPLGEWNTMVIECVGDEVKVWVNGDLVNHGTKCTVSKGQISVQAEGSEVEFRKIDMTPIEKISE